MVIEQNSNLNDSYFNCLADMSENYAFHGERYTNYMYNYASKNVGNKKASKATLTH